VKDKQHETRDAGSSSVRIKVQGGDCLWSIARNYLKDSESVQPSNSQIAEEVANIANENNFAQKHRNLDCILVGETLTIPPLGAIDSNDHMNGKVATTSKPREPRHEESQHHTLLKHDGVQKPQKKGIDQTLLKQTSKTKSSNEQTIKNPINADGTINLDNLNIEALQTKSPTLQNYWGHWVLVSDKPTVKLRNSLDGGETARYVQAENSIFITLENEKQIEQRLHVSSANDPRVIKEKQSQSERMPALVASGIYQYEQTQKVTPGTTDSIAVQNAQALLIQAKVEFELGVSEPTPLAHGVKLTDLLVFNDAEHKKVDDKQSLARIVSAYSSTNPL